MEKVLSTPATLNVTSKTLDVSTWQQVSPCVANVSRNETPHTCVIKAPSGIPCDTSGFEFLVPYIRHPFNPWSANTGWISTSAPKASLTSVADSFDAQVPGASAPATVVTIATTAKPIKLLENAFTGYSSRPQITS